MKHEYFLNAVFKKTTFTYLTGSYMYGICSSRSWPKKSRMFGESSQVIGRKQNILYSIEARQIYIKMSCWALLLVLPPIDTHICYKFLQIASQCWAWLFDLPSPDHTSIRSRERGYSFSPLESVKDLSPPTYCDLCNEGELPHRRLFKCLRPNTCTSPP